MYNRTNHTHSTRLRAFGAAFGLLVAVLAMLALIAPTTAAPRRPKPTPTPIPMPTPTPAPVGVGSWSMTGAPTLLRIDFASVRLADGRVLVSGGSDGSGTRDENGNFVWMKSAELYDPATGIWAPTGDMVRGRRSHTLTLLNNGLVLAAGGDDNAGNVTTELYDPATGMWTPTGNMSLWRAKHKALRLNDGRVFVTGGDVSFASQTGEIYDPATGVWTTTPFSPRATHKGALVLLDDGRVFTAGADLGFYSGISAEAAIYDPVANTWTVTTPMSRARSEPLAVRLADDRVLVAGSEWSDRTAEIYNPASGTWSSVGSMALGHGNGEISLLANGRALVTGGANDEFGFDIVAAAEIFDPATGQWQPAASMNVARQHHAAETLLDGRVLVIRGSAEVYTP